MKYLVLSLSILILLSACSKSSINAPKNTTQNVVFYKDGNIEITNFTTTVQNTGGVQVGFSTLYEKNIDKIELFSGVSTSNLCSITSFSNGLIEANAKIYNYTDFHPKGKNVFYLLKVIIKDGSWAYTPVYSVNIN